MATEEELQHQQELSETLTKFRNLIASPGWEELLRIAKVQVDNRRRKVMMGPLESTSKVTEQQWLLGEACGIDTIMGLPASIIEVSAAELKGLFDSQPIDEETQDVD